MYLTTNTKLKVNCEDQSRWEWLKICNERKLRF